jgi:hypothetical protein
LLDNTIDGRIGKAAMREDYLHTRPHLYRLEGELLAHLGLKKSSPVVKEQLKLYFSVTSRRQMNHNQHWLWVKHLEGEVGLLEQD